MTPFDTLMTVAVIAFAISLVLILCCCLHCKRRKVRSKTTYSGIGGEEAVIERTIRNNANRKTTVYDSSHAANIVRANLLPTVPNVRIIQHSPQTKNANALLPQQTSTSRQQNASENVPTINNKSIQTVATVSGQQSYLQPSSTSHAANNARLSSSSTAATTSKQPLRERQISHQQNASQNVPTIKNSLLTVSTVSGHKNYLQPSTSSYAANAGLTSSTAASTSKQPIIRANQINAASNTDLKSKAPNFQEANQRIAAQLNAPNSYDNKRTRIGRLATLCLNEWNSGEQYYQYIKNYFGITRYDVCAECYERMGDYRHHYRARIAVCNGSCDCGHMSVTHENRVFCRQHKQNSTEDHKNNNQRTTGAPLRERNRNDNQTTGISPCTITWNRDEQYYHCVTCSRAKKLTICKECFVRSEHSRHKHRLFTSEFNGSCDCGDISVMTREAFCYQHMDCDQTLINNKTTYNDSKQIRKMSMLLDVTAVEAKRLAQLNKLESVCELSYKGKIIKDYFNNSQVHSNMKIKLTNVYAVYRGGHEMNFKRNDFLNETRMLLWHGTKREHLSGIFDTGLKLPLSAGMFGNGIYFADRVTKSANYTDCGLYQGFRGNTGVLLLCEVAVGNMYEAKSAQMHLTEPPDNYQSVKGLGQNQPSSSCTYTKKKTIVPLGATKSSSGQNFSLIFNEYIVYDPRRVLIKFFVEFERN